MTHFGIEKPFVRLMVERCGLPQLVVIDASKVLTVERWTNEAISPEHQKTAIFFPDDPQIGINPRFVAYGPEEEIAKAISEARRPDEKWAGPNPPLPRIADALERIADALEEKNK